MSPPYFPAQSPLGWRPPEGIEEATRAVIDAIGDDPDTISEPIGVLLRDFGFAGMGMLVSAIFYEIMHMTETYIHKILSDPSLEPWRVRGVRSQVDPDGRVRLINIVPPWLPDEIMAIVEAWSEEDFPRMDAAFRYAARDQPALSLLLGNLFQWYHHSAREIANYHDRERSTHG